MQNPCSRSNDSLEMKGFVLQTKVSISYNTAVNYYDIVVNEMNRIMNRFKIKIEYNSFQWIADVV